MVKDLGRGLESRIMELRNFFEKDDVTMIDIKDAKNALEALSFSIHSRIGGVHGQKLVRGTNDLVWDYPVSRR